MEKVKEWLINNALTIFLGLPTLGGSIVAILTYIENQTISVLDIILICTLFTILLVLLGKAIWNSVSYRSYHYPWLKIRTMYNYKVLKKTISYKRTDEDKLIYKRSLEIQSLANRLESVNDKFIWTGVHDKPLKITPDKDENGRVNIKKITKKSRIGIWSYFSMELLNHMTKGEKQTIAYKWPMISNCSLSSPFFSSSTDELTKSLELKLSLGKEYANQQIICEEFRAIESDYKISSVVHNLDESGSYTWNIPRIKRFRYYRIRWSWEIGQPAAEIGEIEE